MKLIYRILSAMLGEDRLFSFFASMLHATNRFVVRRRDRLEKKLQAMNQHANDFERLEREYEALKAV